MTYKGTTKPLPQIARELGVSYVLEGTIRWEKDDAGGRVRVTPQLVDVSNDAHIWSNSHERELSGIFTVQTQIAENVSQALNIMLSPSEQPRLESSGPKDPRAYLALLRGLALAYGNPSRANCEQAILEFQQAVQIDTGFARAWAELSMEYSYKYHSWERNTELAVLAKTAARKSNELDSCLAAGRAAAGYYYYWCLEDYDQALSQFAEAERLAPHDSRWIQATAWIWRRQGRFDDVRVRLTRALELAPRDALLLAEVAATCNVVRDYAGAAHYAELALAVDPGLSWAYCYLISSDWSRGRLSDARHHIEEMGLNEGSLDLWFLQFLYERDYGNGANLLLKSGIDQYDFGDFYYPSSLLAAKLLELAGDVDWSHNCFDSARVLLLEKISQFPDDPRYYSSLGLALAGLGQKEEAIDMGLHAVKLCPIAHDVFRGPAFLGELAYIHLATGDFDTALREFEHLLSIPSQFNARILQLDPRLDPVRDDPRFKAMIKKYEDPDAI